MIRLVVGVGLRGKWRKDDNFLRGMERNGMGYRVGSDEASSKPLPSFSGGGGACYGQKMLSLYFEIQLFAWLSPGNARRLRNTNELSK